MERLRELRLQKKISQQQLADILHVTQQSIYKYEHGLRSLILIL
jgi:transcriptional regulator with XRE-family HTH domain